MRRSNSLFIQSILLYIFLFLFHPSLNAATLKFDDGFESGNLNNLSCSGNCPSITTSPTKSGKYAGNFVLTPRMSTNYRTEVVFKKSGTFQRGKEYWMSMDYRLEDWKEDSSPEVAPFQVHSAPSSFSSGCNLGAAVTNAPFLMVTRNKEAFFKTYGDKVLWRGSIQRKKWINIKVRFKMSSGSDGYIEAWKDGVRLGRVNGPTGPKKDNCGKPMKDDYLKVGVYKWDWRQGKIMKSTRRQLLVDNLKIVEGANGASLMGNIKSAAPVVKQAAVKSAPASSTNSALGLIAHWSMDSASGSAIPDKSGHVSPAYLVNGAQLVSGRGVKFDGVNDYLNLGNINIHSPEVTMSAWFLASDLANCAANDCRIISKATGVEDQDHFFMVSTIKVGSKTRLRFRLKTNGVTSALTANHGDIYNNDWIHVAAVYDGNRMSLYKDGVEVGSMPKTGRITTHGGVPFWVGNNPNDARSRPWKGHIDDVRVYNYALSNGEIAKLAK